MNLNRLIASSISLVALAYALSSSIFIVDQRKFAVVFSFGQIVRVIEHPGLQFKYPAPFENVLEVLLHGEGCLGFEGLH